MFALLNYQLALCCRGPPNKLDNIIQQIMGEQSVWGLSVWGHQQKVIEHCFIFCPLCLLSRKDVGTMSWCRVNRSPLALLQAPRGFQNGRLSWDTPNVSRDSSWFIFDAGHRLMSLIEFSLMFVLGLTSAFRQYYRFESYVVKGSHICVLLEHIKHIRWRGMQLERKKKRQKDLTQPDLEPYTVRLKKSSCYQKLMT